ncbi:hypothetical protein [Streptomyces sp. NPDC056713]|uniref:hypothetical protein n=1 Tax=Streptomyces sp. NPDC056713 TaxID=3345921 RepID=UPI003696D3D9
MRSLSAVVGAALTAATLTAGVTVPANAASQRHISCGQTALKNAIRNLNMAGGGSLRLARNCVYTLTTPDNSTSGSNNGLPVITTRVTVDGNGSTIRRSTKQGTPDFRIFQIKSPGHLTLSNLTIRDGRAQGVGGGIWLSEAGTSLTLRDVEIRNNAAFTSPNFTSSGGGIDNDGGTVTARDTVIADNFAGNGGGMDQDDGTASIRNSKIIDNTSSSSGGGIWASGTLSLTDSTVSGNSGSYGGVQGFGAGGGMNLSQATTRLTRTTVSHNTQGGPVGDGGGIRNSDGRLTVDASTIYANRTTGAGARGGGLANVNGATATLTHSSVTYNVANTDPGGILNEGGTVNLVSTRVENNIRTNCTPSSPALVGCTD